MCTENKQTINDKTNDISNKRYFLTHCKSRFATPQGQQRLTGYKTARKGCALTGSKGLRARVSAGQELFVARHRAIAIAIKGRVPKQERKNNAAQQKIAMQHGQCTALSVTLPLPHPVLCAPCAVRGIINTLATRVSSIGGYNNKRSGRAQLLLLLLQRAMGRGQGVTGEGVTTRG